MTTHLNLNIENGIATVALNRPEVHNAFDDQLIAELVATFKALDTREDVQVLVLTSEGKHFSAGADLNWMKRMATLTEDQNRDDANALAELMYILNSMSMPTIAKINGAAYGGAVGLIACCDMAVATERSRFCLSEVKIGLSPAVISPFVVAAMGQRQARRYFLTGEVFDTQTAIGFDLIHEMAKDEDELDEKVSTLASACASNSPQAMSKTKKLIERVARGAIDDDMRAYTVNLIAAIRVSEQGQEGLSAFLEKRSPNWQRG